MCGRYGFYEDRGDDKARAVITMLEKLYPDAAVKTGEIFPGDTAPGVICREGRIVPVPAVFGFPGFDGKKPLINARAETAAEKPTFAEAFREQRIVLPANGFYEWGREPDRPKYWFTLNAAVFYLCGLYRVENGVPQFVILTREAEPEIAFIHDRMPVMIPKSRIDDWIDPAQKPEDVLLDLLKTMDFEPNENCR